MSLTLSSSVGEISGIGDVRKRALQKMGIVQIGDLLNHFPRAYQNRGNTTTLEELKNTLRPGEGRVASVIMTVSSTATARLVRRGMNVLKFRAFDQGATVEVTYFNQSYLKDTFVTGATFRFWGKFFKEGGALKVVSPIYEPYAEGIELPSFVPVYPLTTGISQKLISSLVKIALEISAGESEDIFSESFREENGIVSRQKALEYIHCPESEEDIERAKRRLCFEEIFLVSASLASAKSRVAGNSAPAIPRCDMTEYLSALPYTLTGAQRRSLDEICNDMAKETPMRRILIGDVGCGKTVVAGGAAYCAVKAGYQVALMVPTEILAKQHYEDMKGLFTELGINVELLTGSTSQAEKRRILEALSGEKYDLTGSIDIIIGTHALIGDGVKFRNPALVITDEQHRFGVSQRAALAAKAKGVHSLVMSATPIPRTLSLVYYGDLSLSRIDEMPPGRQKVETFVVDERYRDRLNAFIRAHAKAGNRTYVVCPMVEESQLKAEASVAKRSESDPEEMSNYWLFDREETHLKSTVEQAREMELRLPDLRVGLVHGKMKASQKDTVMKQFCQGELDVLVSTTVIEVGVNVPEATLMIVENAERFGLSQLHQLRGRVGRGDRKSFCILVSDSKSEKSRERLSVMKHTNDGYEIAEADLKLRGAGDFFARGGHIRQHGAEMPMFFDSSGDSGLVEKAVEAARLTVAFDPEFALEENRKIGEIVRSIKNENDNTIS